MRNNFGFGSIFILLMVLSVFLDILEGLGPFLIIFAVIAAITYGTVKASGNLSSNNNRYQRTYGSQKTTKSTNLTVDQQNRINSYLKDWFLENKSLPIGTNIDLRLHDNTYTNLSSLDVYRDNTFICSLENFKNRYPDSYIEIMREVDGLATRNNAKKAAAEKKAAEEAKPKDSNYYINIINQLNDEIPDEEISNGLYETTALLKQIEKLENKFPKAKEKLKKLYEYYLPILVKILQQYENLQSATTDPSYKETSDKLKKTIKLINDAMKTIISSMTDEDFINLSADIATLEAVLQKDGLTSNGNMTMNGPAEKSDLDGE